MYTDIPNHEPSLLDDERGPYPAGAAIHGRVVDLRLGTDNKNLPGFVVLCPEVPTTVGPPLWNSAFLPPMYQGRLFPTTFATRNSTLKN